jgi:hypothetical protein
MADGQKTAEVFAEWLQLQGITVLRTASTFWCTEGLGVYQAFPYHHLIQPSEEELSFLFHRQKALVVRYSAPIEAGLGSMSHHLVYDQPGYGFENLGYRTRKNVRKGLRSCKVERIPLERVAEDGWALHLDTLSRQDRRRGFTRDAWRTRFLCASKLPGFEAWGSTVGENLAAYLIAFHVEDWVYIIDQKSLRKYLNLNVNNALVFTVTQEFLSRPGIRSILYSMESLDARTTIEEFKLHMGYVRKPVRQRIAFHPYISPLVNSFTHSAVRYLSQGMPMNRPLSKAEGMMRMYLEEATRERASLQPNV